MMIAYITLEYSSDGPPPSRVDSIMHDLGALHHGTYYLLEAGNDADLHRVLDRLHDELKGTGVRYKVSLDRPERSIPPGRSREEVLKWVDAGLVDETLVDILERDTYEFKQEALRYMRAAVDHVIMLRRREEQEERDRQHREAVKEEIAILLRATGGRTFQEALDSFDMDEAVLEDIMQEMIDEGTIAAKQKGHIVIYVLAAPTVRSLAR
jgi:hypothetical protein